MVVCASSLKGAALREKAHTEFLPTGIQPLDLLLSGGIPRGQMTEIVGSLSSGKTSLLLSILAQATTRGELVAYIDSFASLDPAFARKAGVDLQRLLWIRSETSLLPEKALQAADILARAGGFGVVALDLETQARKANRGVVRKISFHCWFRLKRAVEGTATILLVLGNEAAAGSAASVVISLRRRKAQWCSTTENSPTRHACLRHACLLCGICSEVELLRGKNPNHATLYCHF
ncbi:DNA recombination/repair protein RecA [Acidobacteria bacterium AH-259-G07]|nr:DNA recombination/repair protein RecA [Acidobacteria bacterium AH-259-G07]